MKKISIYIITIITVLIHVSLHACIIIGHRGACGYMPENTLSSFSKAIECGADMVELDVWKCASGELVVFHDVKVDQLTDGVGYIEQKTIAEIKRLTVLGGEKIPTLGEVLDLVDHRVKVCIELKGMNVASDVVEVIEQHVRHKGWQYEDFFIVSFNHPQLQEVRSINKLLSTGALICGIPITFGLFALQAGADAALLYVDCINQHIIDDIHNRGMHVYVFTVNDCDDIARMIACGVDGIVTDYPDRLYQLLHQKN